MELIEIDIISLKSEQAVIRGPQHVGPPEMMRGYFGREKHALAVACDCFTYD